MSRLYRVGLELVIENSCRNELDCRKSIIHILKETRGEDKWNGPDGNGNQVNWREDLHLSQWDGESYGDKRIQVDVNGMIKELFLRYLGLRYDLPDLIGNLSSLTALYVYNNQLTSLPNSIGNLTSLTRLYVRNNQLSSLPDSISNLTSLADLDVSCNQLSSLQDSISNLTSLTGLNVYDNPITTTQEGKDEVTRRFGRPGLTLVV